ncbi:MAG TPA: hypothetical protein VKW78_14015 [Terriglobales bacterium]|nr:hypothetical protein [Terriglobales bacterium]
MALKKVVVYFEDQQDALRFTLAAGSLISGEYSGMSGPLSKLTLPLSRASRITAGGSLGKEEPETCDTPILSQQSQAELAVAESA